MTDTDTDTTTPPAAGETDPRVLAMARAFDRTRRKVDGLDSRVAELSADVNRLAGVITTPRPSDAPAGVVGPPDGVAPDEDCAQDGGIPAVRSWLLADDAEQAVKDLAELIEWLARVYLRYPGAELSACWLWHPHVIEELWQLRCAHADAYDTAAGSWLRVGDWHDRQRPAVSKRVRDAVGKCDLSLHAVGKPQAQPSLVAPLAAHSALIARAWASGRARPEPSVEQVSEGEAYFQALFRSQR